MLRVRDDDDVYKKRCGWPQWHKAGGHKNLANMLKQTITHNLDANGDSILSVTWIRDENLGPKLGLARWWSAIKLTMMNTNDTLSTLSKR